MLEMLEMVEKKQMWWRKNVTVQKFDGAKCDDANVWNKQNVWKQSEPYGPCAKFQEITME